MSTEKLQAHVRLKKADKERIEDLGRWWRIKSANAVILEAIKVAHGIEFDLRKIGVQDKGPLRSRHVER